MKPQRRLQRTKASAEQIRHVQGLRSSNAAAPIPIERDPEGRRIRKYGILAVIEDDDDDTDNPYLWS